jgi:hypothetical protein
MKMSKYDESVMIALKIQRDALSDAITKLEIERLAMPVAAPVPTVELPTTAEMNNYLGRQFDAFRAAMYAEIAPHIASGAITAAEVGAVMLEAVEYMTPEDKDGYVQFRFSITSMLLATLLGRGNKVSGEICRCSLGRESGCKLRWNGRLVTTAEWRAKYADAWDDYSLTRRHA